MASWLVHSPRDQMVWVRVLAGDIVLCPCAIKFFSYTCYTCIVHLSTQVYKWVLLNLMLGVTQQWTGIQSRGSINTPSHLMPQKLEMSASLNSLMGHLAHMRTF